MAALTRLGDFMPRPERPIGPGDDVLVQFATDLRRLRERAGSPTYRDLARLAHYSAGTLSEAAGGRKLPSLGVAQAYVRACGGDPDEWEKRWLEVAAELAVYPDAPAEQESPYVGLAAFGYDDADRFFGRDKVIEELLARLTKNRFVAVFGASGAGKSSVLRAGLAPRLKPGQAVVFTPGSHPMAELGLQLAGAPADGELVLIVDQFEEIFTVCRDQAEREKFVSTLLWTAQHTGNRTTRVVIGVRADFYAHCLDFPSLATALDDSQVLVRPMSTEDLRQAITQPAAQVNCAVEGALLAVIIADAAGQTGTLPLISHALVETWHRRRGNTLTLTGYQAAGGIQGALAQTAETLYTTLSADQQRVTKNLLLRLTVLGEGTEDTKRRISSGDVDLTDPDVRTVLGLLTEARLVTVDTDTVELTHEALIRAWPRLRRWLTEDRDRLRTGHQLTEATHTWLSLEKDPGVLYRGTRLAIAREHPDDLNNSELAFLDASIDAELAEHQAEARRNRVLRRLTVALTLLLIVAIVVGVVAVQQRQDAVSARQIAVSRQIAAEALSVAEVRPGTAMLLAMEAFRLAPTAEARSALLSVSAHQPYQTTLVGHTDAIAETSFSPDGKTLVTSSKDRTVILWDTVRRTHRVTLTGHDTWLRTAVFSPNGRTVVTGGDDGKAVVWDASSGEKLAILGGHTAMVKTVAFSPDNRILATAGADGTVILWDFERRTRLTTLTGHTGYIESVLFSPNGRMIASASQDHTINLWDPVTGTLLKTLIGHGDSVDDISFSPDGKTLASVSQDETLALWDMERFERVVALHAHAGPARAVRFSPDGRTIATGGHDQKVALWDTATRTLISRLEGHTGNIYTLAFHPTQTMLVSAGEDGTIVMWDPTRVPLAGHTDWINGVQFAPDGRTVASASTDGTVNLWDTAQRRRRATLKGDTGPVNGLAFSPDGGTLATATGKAQHPPQPTDFPVTLWDMKGKAEPVRLAGHTNRVMTAAFSPDGKMIASGSTDDTAILWDVASRTAMATLQHGSGVSSVAFSPDGRTLAVAEHNGKITLWDVAQRKLLAELTGHKGPVRGLAFSPDGRILASASADETVMLWDLESRRVTAVLSGNAGAVNTMAFSPDGTMIAAAGTDRSVVLWDVAQRTRLATLTGHSGTVKTVAFSPDSRTLATGSVDKNVILWDLDTQRVASYICESLARNLTEQEWAKSLSEIPYHETCPAR
jgi:WD40 repeat protein